MSTQKRDEVLDQLAIFLRNKNAKKNGFSSFLRHPFLLMLIGTVAVALITNLWASQEKRNFLELQWQRAIIEKQLKLYESLHTHFHRSGSYANTWFQMLIGFARESIKQEGLQDSSRIEFYKSRGMESEKLFMDSTPFGTQLGQIRVLFRTAEVKNSADEMDDKWSNFIESLHNCSQQMNTRTYNNEHVDEWEKLRKNAIDELEDIKVKLAEHMSKEIISLYTNQ